MGVHGETDPLVERILRCASRRFGPATCQALERGALDEVVSRCRGGVPIEEAVSAFAFEDWRARGERCGEFLNSFRGALAREGSRSIGRLDARRRDSEDLIASVFGDVLDDDRPLEFHSRAAFLSFLRQRLRWKALGHESSARQLPIEEERSEAESPLSFLSERRRGPGTVALENEAVDRLTARIFRLPIREREVMCRRLKGERVSEIADSIGIRSDTTSRILASARRRLRDLDRSR